jgi:hypothetical protein
MDLQSDSNISLLGCASTLSSFIDELPLHLEPKFSKLPPSGKTLKETNANKTKAQSNDGTIACECCSECPNCACGSKNNAFPFHGELSAFLVSILLTSTSQEL